MNRDSCSTRLPPDKSLTRTYCLSGGSEAVESTVKLVRRYGWEADQPDKYKTISRWSCFHGNTTSALTLGGHTVRRSHYLPIFEHTPHIEPAYCYRCSFKAKPETCDRQCADELERDITHEGPESVCALIAEPAVGAAVGALVPKDGYWQYIRQICDEYDIELLADQVMTGIGRCGTNFGIGLVRSKATRAWFDRDRQIDIKVAGQAFERGLITYPGNGGVDGICRGHPAGPAAYRCRKTD